MEQNPLTGVSTMSPQAIFLEHEAWLRTIVRSRLPEPDAIEDVMQNIAMAIVRQRDVLGEVNRIGAWLYQIAVRQVLMYRRTTGRRRKMHERLQRSGVTEWDVSGPLQAMLSQEANAQVHEALSEMSELDRQILLLKYTENWSYREIALHLGVQDETIEYRLMKARKNLRHRLRALVDEGTGL
jgi:RNA polymerase sigma factor (sigma-70 family)